MAWIRPPRLQSEYALRMIRQVMGTSKPIVVILTVLLFVASGVSGNASWSVVQHLFASANQADFYWPPHVLGVFALPFLLGLLWFWSRQANERVRVSIIQDNQPPRVKALILFLSPPGPLDKDLIQRILTENGEQRLVNKADRELFKGSWRMPLEAIVYHLERLKFVVVIPSADSAKSPGTQHDFNKFRELTAHLLGPEGRPQVEVLDLPMLVKWHRDEQEKNHSSKGHRNPEPAVNGNTDYSAGVNYENARELVEAVELAYDLLRDCGIAAYDILIDVTAGQKPPTVAGTVVSLAEGKRFQYVSTHDYKVITYDVTYLN